MAYLNTTWHHVRRSPYQAFAAIFITLQTFFVISLFSFVIYASAKVISYFESLPQVTVFFQPEAKDDNIKALEDQLKKSGKVSHISYVSKEQALKRYQEQNKDDPLLLELVTADILPPSLEISTYKIEDLSEVSEVVKKMPMVQEVVFPKDIITGLSEWTNALRRIGIVLSAILGIDAIVIMMIIIGIKISQRREEIEILRLIGATNWYIRWPFVFEGVLYGIAGAVIGWGMAVGAILYATPFLSSFLSGIPILPVSPILFLELLGIELFVAMLLGAFASSLAVLRYLK